MCVCVCGGGGGGERDAPAILILAGVALRDAGVLVRLLLLGVMPFKGGENVSIITYNTVKC